MAETRELERGGQLTLAAGQGRTVRLEAHPPGTPAERTFGFVYLTPEEAIDVSADLFRRAGALIRLRRGEEARQCTDEHPCGMGRCVGLCYSCTRRVDDAGRCDDDDCAVHGAPAENR